MSTKGQAETPWKYIMTVQFTLGRGPWDYVSHILADTDKIAWLGTTDTTYDLTYPFTHDPDFNYAYSPHYFRWGLVIPFLPGTFPLPCTGGTLIINKPKLYGGGKGEGGVGGFVHVNMGASDQLPDTQLQSILGTDIPAFRSVVTVVLSDFWIGIHYYLKPWSFIGARIHTQEGGGTIWHTELAEPIRHNMNPVHILRELIISNNYGLHKDVSTINDANFLAAATTCFNEKLGLSYFWSDDSDVEAMISKVLDHMNAVAYRSPLTGLYEVYLLRNDYVKSSLVHFNDDNIDVVSEFEIPNLDDLQNQVQLTYWEPYTRKNEVVTVNNTALIMEQGVVIPDKITYDMCGVVELATRLAQARLQLVSQPLARMTIKTTRVAALLHIGMAVVVDRPELHVFDTVFRITQASLGTMTNNQVTLELLEDVFDLDSTVWNPVAHSLWTDPVTIPADAANALIVELPYFMYARYKGDTAAQAVPLGSTFVGGSAMHPSMDSMGAQIYADSGTGYNTNGDILSFCPYAETTGTISLIDTTINVINTTYWNLLTDARFIQVGNEIMSIVAHTDTTLIVLRGCLDTLPATHAAGSKCFAWEDFFGYMSTEYFTTETINVKLLTRTGRGQLTLADATAHSVTLVDRMHKPYPPGNLQLNGNVFPVSVAAGASIVVTWSHRNRITETGGLYGQTTGTITPETGTTYNLRLYDSTNTIIYTFTGITAETYTLTALTAQSNVRLELESVRDSLTSWQKYAYVFNIV